MSYVVVKLAYVLSTLIKQHDDDDGTQSPSLQYSVFTIFLQYT